MNALAVLALILVGLRLAALMLQVLIARSPEARNPRPVFDPCLAPYVLRRSAPVSPEGELASALTTGAIDRLRYQQEMAALAASDARADPLVVPPNGKPSP